jgi:hypothetical protein
MDLTGVMSVGTSGGIYQGTGTFASPTTGLKIWNDGGVGRIAGYSASVIQWYANTDGKLYAGAGNVILDEGGITINVGATDPFKIKWDNSGTGVTYLETALSGDTYTSQFITYPGALETGIIYLSANGLTHGYASIFCSFDNDTDVGTINLTNISNENITVTSINLGSTVMGLFAETYRIYDSTGGSNVEVWNIDEDDSNLLSGVLSVRPDTDTKHIFGRAYVGYVYADFAAFGHIDKASEGNYALLQSANGDTYINASTGKNVYHRINNVTIMGMTASGLQLTTGARVTEFSTDTTMAGNSNTAVPTEQAVQEYAAGYKGWDQGASWSTSTTGSYQVVTGCAVTATIKHGEALVFIAISGSYAIGAVLPSWWIGIRLDGGSTAGIGQFYLNHSGLDCIANIAGMHRYSGLSNASHTFQAMVYLNAAGTLTIENTPYRGAYLAVFEVA